MSKSLTAAAINSFDDMVKQGYQGTGVLRPLVRVKDGVIGSTHRFTKMGKGVATPRIPQTDVVPMNIAPAVTTATLADWNAPEYTDIFDQQKVNFDEQRALAHVISSAIGRREDQLVLDALDAASTSLTVAASVGGAATNYNTAKARAAMKLLDAKNVPKADRYMLLHANGLFGLMGDTTATSSDFNTIRMLVDGQVDTWLGFKHITMGDRDEGGLALSGADRTCFAFHGGAMGAMGLAIGVNFRTEVNYIPEKTAWLANGLFAGGSTHIDAEGIVELTCTE